MALVDKLNATFLNDAPSGILQRRVDSDKNTHHNDNSLAHHVAVQTLPCTSLKFAPLPIPHLDHEHEYEEPNTTTSLLDDDRRTTSEYSKPLTVDSSVQTSSSSGGLPSPRFEDEGGDTEEIWYSQGLDPEHVNQSTTLTNGDHTKMKRTASGKKTFRCLASRPRSPNHQSSTSMSYSGSTSFGAMMSTKPVIEDSDTLNSSAVIDDDDDEEEEEEEEEEVSAVNVNESNDTEDEDDHHEAEVARRRSTTLAAAVEKVHKHGRLE